MKLDVLVSKARLLCKKLKPKNHVYIYILSAALANFVIECFSQGGFSQAVGYLTGHIWAFLYNTGILFLTLLPIFFFKRRIPLTIIILGIWIALGATNGIILNYRVTPFTYLDLSMAGNAISMIDSYFSNPQIAFLTIGAILLLLGLIALFIWGPKHKAPINYKAVAIGIASYIVSFVFLTLLALHFNILSTYFGNIAYAYLDYGFPYCFTSTALNTGISRPINYSKNEVLKLGVHIDPQPNPEEEEKIDANIIMIQLESFFDPTHLKGVEFSEDPLPTFRSLKENYSSGFLNVPSLSAGTANTEFEAISGMSMDYFGTGEYPYKTILRKKTCESIPYDLKDLGYSTHAIHNNDATFYGRRSIFKNLGFDTFTPVEYMNVIDHTPNGWAKDKYLTEEIMKCLKSTDNPDFIYTISVQGHGSYPTEVIDENQTISITAGVDDETQKIGLEYYINQIHEMDLFINRLIQELSQLDEKTVLVLFGDHLPGFGWTTSDLDNHNLYQTEYVIWDNFGLERIEKTYSSYQLGAMILDRLNIHHGTLVNFHQQYRNNMYYQKNLKLLQYDMLYGNQYVYGGNSPYQKTEMRYDVEEIAITSAYTTEYYLFITGENFTPHSVVFLNGDEQKTNYINRSFLQLEKPDLEEENEIVIHQLGDGGSTDLGETEAFLFYSEKE